MLDQHTRMLLQIAEARRMHGTSERDGTIHQVWRQGNEQKVRLNIGTRPDGSPWLSPWIKIEDHHGPSRKQHKFHKGQNVKMTTPGADFSQAKVTPSGENNMHPEPEHADDIHNTEQYAASRVRIGPDFEERWLATGGQVQGKDPDQISLALTRWGAKPQNDNDKGMPWDGPDPNQASTQKRHLNWVGSAGNTPTQNGDAIVDQFDKHVKTETTEQNILHKVQSSDGQAMSIPDQGDGSASRTTTDNMKDANVLRKIHDLVNQLTTSTEHTSGQVTHIIMDASGNIVQKIMQKNQILHQIQDASGNFSSFLQQASQQLLQVGQSTLKITSSEISINSQSVNINTEGGGGSSSPIDMPSVDSSGNAPLIVFPTQWSINANFNIVTTCPTRSAQVPLNATPLTSGAAGLGKPGRTSFLNAFSLASDNVLLGSPIFTAINQAIMLASKAASLGRPTFVISVHGPYAANNAALAYTDCVAPTFVNGFARFQRPIDDTGTGFMYCMPGARLRFVSNAPMVSVLLRENGLVTRTDARDFVGAIYVDGGFYQNFETPFATNVVGPYAVNITVSAEPHTYEIILPYADGIEFGGVTVDNQYSVTPAAARTGRLLVCYGDSITQGFWGSEVDHTWPFLLAQSRGFRCINMGYGGRTTVGSDGIYVADLAPDIITVLMGANDYFSQLPVSVYQANFTNLLQNINSINPNVPVYISAPIDTSVQLPIPMSEYQQIPGQVIQALGYPQLIGVDKGLLITSPSTQMNGDGVHPNDAGHAQMAAHWASVIS